MSEPNVSKNQSYSGETVSSIIDMLTDLCSNDHGFDCRLELDSRIMISSGLKKSGHLRQIKQYFRDDDGSPFICFLYSDQISSMRVGELISELSEFPKDTPIEFFDNIRCMNVMQSIDDAFVYNGEITRSPYIEFIMDRENLLEFKINTLNPKNIVYGDPVDFEILNLIKQQFQPDEASK